MLRRWQYHLERKHSALQEHITFKYRSKYLILAFIFELKMSIRSTKCMLYYWIGSRKALVATTFHQIHHHKSCIFFPNQKEGKHSCLFSYIQNVNVSKVSSPKYSFVAPVPRVKFILHYLKKKKSFHFSTYRYIHTRATYSMGVILLITIHTRKV